MFLRNFFVNLHTAMAILVLFEQFLGKIFLNILPLILSPSPNTKHFGRTFSIYACLRRKYYCYQSGSKL